MSEQTQLDRAHGAMQAGTGEDTSARLAFYACLADSELFLLLEREIEAETARPREVTIDGESCVLAFDTEERLAEFTGDIAPYVSLSGRAIVNQLAGQGVGLCLNLGVAPSSFVLPSDGVDWLAEVLASEPSLEERAPVGFSAPVGMAASLRDAISGRLATAAGLARGAYVVHAEYAAGEAGLLLVIVDAVAGAQPALTRAIQEAVAFSGNDNLVVDVAFLPRESPRIEQIARVGAWFDVPALPEAEPRVGAPAIGPGMDPEKPPILR